jgi:hypothetical protein
VERAAKLQHTRLTQTLIELGADVNKSFCSSTSRWDLEPGPPRGALEHALSFRGLETDINLVSILLQHKGDLSCAYLMRAFWAESPEIVQTLLSSRIAESLHM